MARADGASSDGLGRDYWRLLASAASSNLGDGVRLAALPLLAVTLTDDPVLVAGVGAATFLPAVVFGPIGGVIIDRFPRRRLLVVGQIGRGLAVLLFAALLASDRADIWTVYVLAVILGAGEVVVDGASQAAIPNLVPKALLERANARMVSTQLVLDQMVGAALGGVLFALNSVLPFVVDAITFLVGGASVARISTEMAPDTDDRLEASSLYGDAREGFAFLWDSPLLRRMAISIGLINLALSTGFSVLVLLVVDELAAPEAAFGALLAVGAVAGLLGSLVAERIVARIGRAAALVVPLFIEVGAIAAMALAPNVAVVAASLGVQSMVTVLVNIPGRSVRQEAVPDRLLGRVISSYRVLGYLGIPVGSLAGGVITSLAGPRAAFAASAVLMFGAATAMIGAVRHLPTPGPLDLDLPDDVFDPLDGDDLDAWE